MSADDWPDGWAPTVTQHRPVWRRAATRGRLTTAAVVLATVAAVASGAGGYAYAKATIAPEPVTTTACIAVMRTSLAERLAAVLG